MSAPLSDLEEILARHLAVKQRSLPHLNRLRYSSDLDPAACSRSIVLRLRKTKPDQNSAGELLRFHGGHLWESILGDALEAAGKRVLREVPLRPLRPSSWCWADGHADLVLPDEPGGGLLIECKAPRSDSFKRGEAGLVKDAHRWQASAYLHELRAMGVAQRGCIVYLDREGSNAPQVFELDQQRLIPLEAVRVQEAERAALFEIVNDATKALPPRLSREVRAAVMKTGKRIVATADLPWRCSYCAFRGTCRPGAEAIPYKPTPDEEEKAREEARVRWERGENRVVVELGAIPNDAHDPLAVAAAGG